MKRNTTVIVNGKKPVNLKRKLLIEIILLVFIFVFIGMNLQIKHVNKVFAKEVDDFNKLNAKTIFSIDKIYLYSSANAIENKENRPIWNLNLFQFTDMCIYINNNDDTELNYENSIKTLTVDNIKFSNTEVGKPGLYFKNINEMGRSIINLNEGTENFSLDSQKLSNSLNYKVLNDGDINYKEAQIYADASNPLTFEYINNNIKKNEIISDIKNDITFDGNLLRKSGVILSDIKQMVSFRITITNNYDQKFVANVYIDIPLEDENTGDTIYNGKLVKKIETKNYIKFFRVN